MKNNFIVYFTESVFIPSEIKDSDIIFIPYKKGSEEKFLPFSGFLLENEDFCFLSEKGLIGEGKALLWSPGNLSGNEAADRYISNIYFNFRTFPDLYDFNQILNNYCDSISLLNQKNDYMFKENRKDDVYKKLLNVGVALSAERDNRKLLDYIVAKTREITFSDAGSLYLVDEDRETGSSSLLFKIAHNDSNPTDFTEFSMPIMKQSIAGYVALTGEVIKLDNVYEIPGESEYNFNNAYDKSTGYRTRSMLTVPMENHKGKIIGVIQLINKKTSPEKLLGSSDDVEKYVSSFDIADEEVVRALASLAAVSLDNNLLLSEIENLFECLVKASAKAIEQRDPATSGHSLRVARYTVAMAEAVSVDNSPVFRDINFSADHLKGLRYACLLHDFGKVGVRENVLVKANKLYPGMLELIMMRLDYLREKKESDLLRQAVEEKLSAEAAFTAASEEAEKIDTLKSIVTDLNESSFLSTDPDEMLSKLDSVEIITPEEFDLLSIKKGSLNSREREEIESHVNYTYEFLKNIPWPENMSDIPEIAKSHHESLNGKGYPDGITGDKIPFESKLMAVADIYDALTASDRPYKKAVPAEKALNILRYEVENGKLDSDIVEFFIKKKIYEIPGQQ